MAGALFGERPPGGSFGPRRQATSWADLDPIPTGREGAAIMLG